MATLRKTKGSALTFDEMDTNFNEAQFRVGTKTISDDFSLSAGQSALFTAEDVTIADGVTVTLDDDADMFVIDPNIFENFSEDNRHGEIIQTVFTREDVASQWKVEANHPFPGAIITPLETIIKPKYSTSLILMEVSINGVATNDNTGFRIVRDNALITTPGYEGYNNQHHPNYWGVYTNAMTTPQHYYFMYFDKPGTTNELRYCIAFGSSTNATGARFLLNDNDVGSPAQGNEQGVSIIKISEIYQKS